MPTILLPFIMIIIYDANNHNTLTYSRIYNTEKSHPFPSHPQHLCAI